MTRFRTSIIARWLGLLALLGMLLMGLTTFVWFDNEANRGITFSPDRRPIRWAEGPLVGVNAYNIQFEPDLAKVTRTLEMARDLGARYVRLQLPWQDVEIHAKNDFEDRRHEPFRSAWEKYDTLFAEMQRLGLEPIVRIDRPPDWARAAVIATPEWQAGVAFSPNSSGPPDNYGDYADFVGAVVARYKGQVRFIQIWNEPNLRDEWNWQDPDPALFLELLRQASTAIRAANPDAVVLFPSLAPTDGLDARAPLTDLEYLDQIYKLGGADYFDIMSAQAYGLGQPPDEHRYVYARNRSNWNWRQPIDTRIDVSRLPLLREVMEQNGDAATAIWISEFGYVSAPPELPPIWGPPVSEEQKGAYIIGQIERARREWPWVGVMNIWILRWGGAPPDPGDPTQYFALVDQDFTPLPAYTALQRFLAEPPLAGIGAHTWDHPAVQGGDGTWEIRFEGTGLALLGDGQAEVTIDGGTATKITLIGSGDPLVVARGLDDGTHTAQVRGSVAVSAFVVSREPPLAWLWVLGPAALLLALVASGALLGRSLVRP